MTCSKHGDLTNALIFENRCASCRAVEDIRASIMHARHNRRADLLRLASSIERGEISITRDNFSVISGIISSLAKTL